ncbi:MAG: pantoate--beta-alanine ligase [Rickettsiales bacterium TMED131]|nr:MAG: pantoate--beta-alanine ligase [Rickettsiales bacterium TMED131]
MYIVHTIIARSLKALKKNLINSSGKKRVALVPTMGCLHKGHIALINKSQKINCFTVVSIFVNPKQFNNKNDLTKYPSKEKEDIELLKKYKVDIIFIPKKEQIYPDDFGTYLNEIVYSNILCGKYRKNHFSGVATVVLKLFLIVKPDLAVFGEKDFQQLFIIKKIVRDLNLDIKIISIPTVRDKYGLAFSSRNKLLSESHLKIARRIFQKINKPYGGTALYSKEIITRIKKELKKNGVENIEYLEVREANNLETPIKINYKRDTRVFIAIKLGKVRLIDNFKLK